VHSNGSIASSKHPAGSILLADLLGDSDLLKHYRWSKESHSQQQQEHPQQQQQQQQQKPFSRAVAPPAPVWQAWVLQHTTAPAQHYSTSTAAAPAAAAGTAAAAAAGMPLPGAAAWYLQHHQQYHKQQQQQHPMLAAQPALLLSAGRPGNSSSSSSSKGSSFNKYAAAVLQGLPPEDEAVQLARMAAVHGYSLSDVLQQHQQQPHLHSGPGNSAQASGAPLVKDPRSGRLSVAPGGSSGGSSAVGLYGDIARWCDPASLERTLHKRQQQGGAGAAKRNCLGA
jgi:hypothetical protein